MKSNARVLTEAEKGHMKTFLHSLAARHVGQTKCPMNPEQLARIVEASFPQERGAAAWRAMREWWVIREATPPPFKRQDFVGIPILMPNGHRLMIQLSEGTMSPEKYPLFKQGPRWHEVDAGYLFNDTERSDFQDWAYLCVQVAGRSRDTQVMIEQLVDMASTVGQLNRMCPELVRYSFAMTQDALQKQERRSPLPYGWMEVDRRAIHLMLEHLALCYLLPEVSSVVKFQELTAHTEWVFDHQTLLYCDFSARPHDAYINTMSKWNTREGRFSPT